MIEPARLDAEKEEEQRQHLQQRPCDDGEGQPAVVQMPNPNGKEDRGEGGDRAIEHHADRQVGHQHRRDAKNGAREPDREYGFPEQANKRSGEVERPARLAQSARHIRPDPTFIENSRGVDARPGLIAMEPGRDLDEQRETDAARHGRQRN